MSRSALGGDSHLAPGGDSLRSRRRLAPLQANPYRSKLATRSAPGGDSLRTSSAPGGESLRSRRRVALLQAASRSAPGGRSAVCSNVLFGNDLNIYLIDTLHSKLNMLELMKVAMLQAIKTTTESLRSRRRLAPLQVARLALLQAATRSAPGGESLCSRRRVAPLQAASRRRVAPLQAASRSGGDSLLLTGGDSLRSRRRLAPLHTASAPWRRSRSAPGGESLRSRL